MARVEARACGAAVSWPLALLCLAACSGSQPAPEPAPVVTPAIAAAPAAPPRDAARDERIADLELRLLELQTQNTETQARLAEARREVVRAMAKLESLATRAEAASGIAEAEIAVRSLPATLSSDLVGEAKELMELATAEFEKQNYGGSLYLANETKAAAAAARTHVQRDEPVADLPEERSFTTPLPLETIGRANVRAGPGTSFSVSFVAAPGTALTGYSTAKQWLRVTDESGRRGWIAQSLIRGRP